MKVVLSDGAIEALKDAPVAVQRAFYKQLGFLASNLQYPSLRAKKYDEANDLWQARVNRDWRLYFTFFCGTNRHRSNNPPPQKSTHHTPTHAPARPPHPP